MKKLTAIFIMAMIIPTTMAETLKIYPSEDAYTDSSKPTMNFNNANLRIGYNENTGKHRSYLKFDLSQLNGVTVTSAKFSIDPVASVGAPMANLYYVSDDSWRENLIKWSNAPLYSSTITDSKTITSSNRVEFNVMSLINEPDRILSIALVSQQESTRNIYTQFFSKQLTSGEIYWPYLEVVYSGTSQTCPSLDYSNVCCVLNDIQMMNFINAFNKFQTRHSDIQMMNFINKFNRMEKLC